MYLHFKENSHNRSNNDIHFADHKRNIGKTPIHQLHLDILSELFPDATFICKHRPLSQVLSSSLSMYKYQQELSAYDSDSEEFKER